MEGPGTPKILYIGGSGRSGSTLLSRLLGELPGFVAAGELRYLWSEGLGEDRLCGCGTPFSSCAFWVAVGREAFGGWENVDWRDIARLEAGVARQRHIPMLLRSGISGDFDARIGRFRTVLRKLYAAIAYVADARVIVDSSKDPAYALTLWRSFGADLKMAHLVRDSRAVAFSWGRETRALDKTGEDSLLRRIAPGSVGLRWDANNAAMELLHAMGIPYVRLRYEDLITAPAAELGRVAKLIEEGYAASQLGLLENGLAMTGVHHTLAGNPMRFGEGPLTLSLDERWKTESASGDRRLVTILTWPLLTRYGFLHRRCDIAPTGHPSG